ncbi:MAG: type I-C CRISPR-associated protein Cas5c [Planctomycetota bacterium]
MNSSLVNVRVWGDFACFTRPEMKVERVSYPLVTPSAARGILEAIFWEPQMYYVLDSVRVVKRGRWVSFRRNEVVSPVSLDNARTWMNAPDKFDPIHAGGGAADGTQRNMLALEDVEYVLTAEVRLSEVGRNANQELKKYCAEIERRARQGKCFHRPALGVREFAADFEWFDEAQKIELAKWPEEDLGLMLYDVFDSDERATGFRWFSDEEMKRSQSARLKDIEQLPKGERKAAAKEPLKRYEGVALKPKAAFFHAKVENARMDCHPERVRIIRQNTEGGR